MVVLSFVLIAVLVAADQAIKALVLSSLKPISSFVAIPHLLEFRYIENSGAALGIFQGNSVFFGIITIILSAVIIVMMIRYKKHNFLTYASGIMIIAGGIGNLIDRFVHGFVVDYIHVMFFDYIFNFADCLVVVGVILFMIHVFFFMDKDKSEDKAEKGNTVE